MKKHCFATLLFLILMNLAWAQPQRLDGIAAVVGDEIILISDINAMITQYGFQNKINVFKDPQLYKNLSKQFLQQLIDQKLLLIKADEDTIKADQDRVKSCGKKSSANLRSAAGKWKIFSNSTRIVCPSRNRRWIYPIFCCR